MSEQKAIFITGGGGGMGLETGRYFAERGWLVGLYDLSDEMLEEARQGFEPGQVITGMLDVTREEAFAPAIESFCEKSGGRMDVLFNNAGIAPGGLFADMDTSVMRKIIDINVMGVLYGIKAALAVLKATENSLCISTSSSVATYGHANRVVYTASKFAVKGLTEALSLELEQDGVRTAAVLPGCIDTPMLRRETARGRPFEESMLNALPKEGAYRVMPATAIAEAVWSAYQNSDQIHFYVPEEVGDIDRLKGQDINLARQETRNFLYRGG